MGILFRSALAEIFQMYILKHVSARKFDYFPNDLDGTRKAHESFERFIDELSCDPHRYLEYYSLGHITLGEYLDSLEGFSNKQYPGVFS